MVNLVFSEAATRPTIFLFFLNDFETSCNMELLFWKGTEIKNIKHLHQLQNLYFALTGKEIEIKF